MYKFEKSKTLAEINKTTELKVKPNLSKSRGIYSLTPQKLKKTHSKMTTLS
jgi:hypothetical protein